MKLTKQEGVDMGNQDWRGGMAGELVPRDKYIREWSSYIHPLYNIGWNLEEQADLDELEAATNKLLELVEKAAKNKEKKSEQKN